MYQPTAGNAEQFKQSFREEAREILVDLESALLELNENRTDLELVGRVFRAMHTLKGSGAMFGFEKLAAFTHSLETAFDQVRNGKLQIDSKLIDLTLAALDQIRALVEEGSSALPPDAEICARILTDVRQLASIAENSAPAAKTVTSAAPVGTLGGTVCEWRVCFTPGPDMMLNGTNPLLLLQELRQLGGLSVRASMAGVPPFPSSILSAAM
jgi:two-component system chemotaxis sensor kinase CheA